MRVNWYFNNFEPYNTKTLPWWLIDKESTCKCRRCWIGKIPCRRKWQPIPVFLPRKSHGQRSLVGLQATEYRRVGHDWATKQQRQQQTHTEREPPPASVVNFSHGLNGSSFLYSAFFLILALWNPPFPQSWFSCASPVKPCLSPLQGVLSYIPLTPPWPLESINLDTVIYAYSSSSL